MTMNIKIVMKSREKRKENSVLYTKLQSRDYNTLLYCNKIRYKKNNEVRPFGGTNGLQIGDSHREIDRTCELTICVRVNSSSAMPRGFRGLGQIKRAPLGMLSNLEVSFRTSDICNAFTPCRLQTKHSFALCSLCSRHAECH